MILVCPLCQTRFLMPASHFTGGSRQLRCARCRHSWWAEGHEEIAGSPDTAPAVEITRAPVENISVFTKLWLALSALCASWRALSARQKHWIEIGSMITALLILVAIVVFDRDDIADRWPAMGPVYDALGLDINYDHGGEGLAFEQMRSDLRFDGGRMELHIEGIIHNKTQKMQAIPPFLATALGADGKVIESWQIEPPAAKVAPDEEVPFGSTINAPHGTAVNINLSFVEKKKDASK